jgi:AcrR family transcriptional regulator
MPSEREIAGRVDVTAQLPSRQPASERVSRTARRLFYRRGIRAVGVEEIVAEAGVTKPSLYRNFSSKDALVADCLQARFDRIMGWWDELDLRIADDPLTRLRTLIAEVAQETRSPSHRGCALTNAAVEFPEPGHPARTVAESYKGAIRTRLIALTEQLPVREPVLLADGIILLIEGARASRHTSGAQGPAASMEAVANALLDAFLAA